MIWKTKNHFDIWNDLYKWMYSLFGKNVSLQIKTEQGSLNNLHISLLFFVLFFENDQM